MVLAISPLPFPALTGWAKLWRASGAPCKGMTAEVAVTVALAKGSHDPSLRSG